MEHLLYRVVACVSKVQLCKQSMQVCKKYQFYFMTLPVGNKTPFILVPDPNT